MENKEFEVPAPYEPKRFVVDDMRGDVLCNFISAIMDGGNAIYWTSRSPNDAVFWPCFCAHGIPLPFPIGPTSVALMVKEYWKSTNASRIVLEEMPGRMHAEGKLAVRGVCTVCEVVKYNILSILFFLVRLCLL